MMIMDDNDLKKLLRVKAHSLKPIVNIGKGGVTEGVISLLNREIDQKKLIKIKILKSAAYERDSIVSDIVKGTSAMLVQRVGHVVILYRERPLAKEREPSLNSHR